MKQSSMFGKLIGSICMATILASMFVSHSALAEKGMWEMSVAGNISNTSSTYTSTFGSSTTDTTQTFINADVGRYFTPKLVGRVSVSMFGSDSGGGNSSLGTAAGVGVKYYFGEAAKSKWIPFIQGGVNIVMFSSTSAGNSSDAFGAGVVGGGGISHFLTEEVSIDLAGQLFYNSMTVNVTGSPTLEDSGQRVIFGVTARY